MPRCKACGIQLREGARFCDMCGAKVERLCPSCGEVLRDQARFCDLCGIKLPLPRQVDKPARKWAVSAGRLHTVALRDDGAVLAVGDDQFGQCQTADWTDMIAVSESTPGPIGVNMATYVGFVTGGIPGAVVATVGLVTPSVIVILLIARVLKAFRENQYVDAGFYGLRPCSVGLIAAAGVLVFRIALLHTDLIGTGATLLQIVNWKAVALAAVLLTCTRYVKKLKGLHPVVFILASAAVGMLFQF